MKRCRGCGEEKSLEDFYRHPEMADGHLNYCKPCVKTRVAEHRDRNRDRLRAYDRGRANLPDRVAKRREVAERWRAEPELKQRRAILQKSWRDHNKDKRAAHVAVGNALRDGKLKRQACERCGDPQADAHHDDYSKPLDVRWLCRPHHAARHRELRAMERGES